MSGTWVTDVKLSSDFSLSNIPFGIISTAEDTSPHVATAIGTYVVDLKLLSAEPWFDELFQVLNGHESVFGRSSLNEFAALGRATHRAVRKTIQDLLAEDTPHGAFFRDNANLRRKALLRLNDVQMHIPMEIGDYTDFYAGYHHAFAVGTMFRGPQNALQPNYNHLPVGYHGRASSVVVSGTPVRRPVGQILLDPTATEKIPVTMPCRRLDFELELGCFLTRQNEMGRSVSVDEADEYIFGYVLLNDWSARDIQSWEYVPLGPFNSKNFASTISPWVVLADALEPFRAKGIPNPGHLQPYLVENQEENVFDIKLEVDLTCSKGGKTTIASLNAKYLLWSFPQMIAHHSLGGCPMRVGDLLGSGTISGPEQKQRGSLLEMSENGRTSIRLQGTDVRTFLEDGDEVIIRGYCDNNGQRVGFGNCSGVISPSLHSID